MAVRELLHVCTVYIFDVSPLVGLEKHKDNAPPDSGPPSQRMTR